MNGLRVYINPEDARARGERAVFYSRRESGPYYCWRFEEETGQWCSFRVHTNGLMVRTLCLASWKLVPTELQAKLGEHYLD
jgi:hypothetical protein